MDSPSFDILARSLGRHLARRAALGALGAGLTALLARRGLGDIAARKHKHKRRKKKLRRNAFGCVNVGGACRGNDNNCCSGICEGPKPKQGKKDTSRCVGHDASFCAAGADSCAGQDFPCGTGTSCYQTTGRASFCAIAKTCGPCKKDVDCQTFAGHKAACIVCESCVPDNTACAFDI